MAAAQMPTTIYVVVRDYGPKHGIGCPDVTPSRDEAYDQFAESADHGYPVAVWRVDTFGSLPVGIHDETDAFERELQEVCIARDLDWPDVIRFEMTVVQLAAE